MRKFFTFLASLFGGKTKKTTKTIIDSNDPDEEFEGWLGV